MAAQTSAQAGAPSAKPRQFKYDFVRFVAMTWVIGVHALTVVDAGRRLGSWYVVLCQAIFFTANAIFFMLSGKFNLVRRNGEDWRGFYVRKARGILLPVLVLFLIRTGYDVWPDLGTPLHFLKTFVLNAADYFDYREYWFVFQLLSMLAVTPFLVLVIESLDRSKKKLLLCLGLLWFTVSFFMTNLGYELGHSFMFGGFWFAYLIGPFVEELFAEATRRRILMLAGVLAPLRDPRRGALWIFLRRLRHFSVLSDHLRGALLLAALAGRQDCAVSEEAYLVLRQALLYGLYDSHDGADTALRCGSQVLWRCFAR